MKNMSRIITVSVLILALLGSSLIIPNSFAYIPSAYDYISPYSDESIYPVRFKGIYYWGLSISALTPLLLAPWHTDGNMIPYGAWAKGDPNWALQNYSDWMWETYLGKRTYEEAFDHIKWRYTIGAKYFNERLWTAAYVTTVGATTSNWSKPLRLGDDEHLIPGNPDERVISYLGNLGSNLSLIAFVPETPTLAAVYGVPFGRRVYYRAHSKHDISIKYWIPTYVKITPEQLKTHVAGQLFDFDHDGYVDHYVRIIYAAVGNMITGLAWTDVDTNKIHNDEAYYFDVLEIPKEHRLPNWLAKQLSPHFSEYTVNRIAAVTQNHRLLSLTWYWYDGNTYTYTFPHPIDKIFKDGLIAGWSKDTPDTIYVIMNKVATEEFGYRYKYRIEHNIKIGEDVNKYYKPTLYSFKIPGIEEVADVRCNYKLETPIYGYLCFVIAKKDGKYSLFVKESDDVIYRIAEQMRWDPSVAEKITPYITTWDKVVDLPDSSQPARLVDTGVEYLYSNTSIYPPRIAILQNNKLYVLFFTRFRTTQVGAGYSLSSLGIPYFYRIDKTGHHSFRVYTGPSPVFKWPLPLGRIWISPIFTTNNPQHIIDYMIGSANMDFWKAEPQPPADKAWYLVSDYTGYKIYWLSYRDGHDLIVPNYYLILEKNNKFYTPGIPIFIFPNAKAYYYHGSLQGRWQIYNHTKWPGVYIKYKPVAQPVYSFPKTEDKEAQSVLVLEGSGDLADVNPQYQTLFNSHEEKVHIGWYRPNLNRAKNYLSSYSPDLVIEEKISKPHFMHPEVKPTENDELLIDYKWHLGKVFNYSVDNPLAMQAFAVGKPYVLYKAPFIQRLMTRWNAGYLKDSYWVERSYTGGFLDYSKQGSAAYIDPKYNRSMIPVRAFGDTFVLYPLPDTGVIQPFCESVQSIMDNYEKYGYLYTPEEQQVLFKLKHIWRAWYRDESLVTSYDLDHIHDRSGKDLGTAGVYTIYSALYTKKSDYYFYTIQIPIGKPEVKRETYIYYDNGRKEKKTVYESNSHYVYVSLWKPYKLTHQAAPVPVVAGWVKIDYPIENIDGRIYLPVRIFEKLVPGSKIVWDPELRSFVFYYYALDDDKTLIKSVHDIISVFALDNTKNIDLIAKYSLDNPPPLEVLKKMLDTPSCPPMAGNGSWVYGYLRDNGKPLIPITGVKIRTER